ncbi:MAG: DUF1592 domain-containing protein [Pirellulales bacterium]|nr:DUF1592 domain-containing protein [Pirellulales bacterium]
MPVKNLIHLAAFAIAIGLPPVRSDATDAFSSLLQPTFAAHCVKCHGEEGRLEGEVNLLNLRSFSDLLRQPDLLETLIGVLSDQDMPPEEEEPLEVGTRDAMIQHLEAILEQSLATQSFASTPIRRMNRFQYNNAVVDLLELERNIFRLNERLMRRYTDYFHPEKGKMPPEVEVASRPLGKDRDLQRAEGFMGAAAFPQDLRAEHGYDNRADHLTLSPLLLESFLLLSQTIVDSRDLNPKECRSWNRFFMPPTDGDQLQAIRTRLTEFLRRAFRRPVNPETLDRFVAFAKNSLESGASFTTTMKTVVGATLASPDFLYLYDTQERGEASATRQPLGDFELASRLSFFLWSSIPDATLLDLAQRGELSEPSTLNAQIDRMLNDRRTARFCEAFPSQWLQLDRLITSIPDPEKFESFYFVGGYRVSMHMMMEPLLLFETVYIEDRSILELIDPKFSWRSDVLARSYNGDAKTRGGSVNKITFKRIPVTDPRWGGVITNAAVMTMTSSPTRTQPITRGAWVNTVIFNDPPDPPPADVPPLPEPDEGYLKNLTIRERFSEHRTRQDCASCHKQIDPLGFALENYGPTGLWRDKYENGRQVDPSGKLFNRHEFMTSVEFKRSIMKEKRRFVRGFSAHLLSYALGRELSPADSPALAKIAESAMSGQDSIRTILKMVALSEPFHHKNTRGAPLGEVEHEE